MFQASTSLYKPQKGKVPIVCLAVYVQIWGNPIELKEERKQLI